MALNLVIKVDENFNPENQNIIIYNNKKKIWETQTKESFLTETNKKLKEKDDDIKKLKEEINKLNTKISKLANIVKGELI